MSFPVVCLQWTTFPLAWTLAPQHSWSKPQWKWHLTVKSLRCLQMCLTCKNIWSDKADSFSPKMSLPVTDWIFGPKSAEVDPEDGTAEEERRLSISSRHTATGGAPSMEREREMLLPGFQQGDREPRRPPPQPPLRSAIASSYPGEKRMSTHSVTFERPAGPFVTSLWVCVSAVAHVSFHHVFAVVRNSDAKTQIVIVCARFTAICFLLLYM